MSALLSLILVGCAEDEYHKADVITFRTYTVTEQSGLFTTKENTYDYIEYSFEYDGELIIERDKTTELDISDETEVIVHINSHGVYCHSELQLSLEDYKKLYGIDKE